MLESHFSEVRSQQNHPEMRQFDPDKRVDADNYLHKTDQDRFDPDQRVSNTQTDCTNTSIFEESDKAKLELSTPDKTLIEEIGRDKFNEELLKTSEYYDKYIFIKFRRPK